jgi:hypothetical protein
MDIKMTNFERRKQFLHEKLIGKTVRLEPLGDHYPDGAGGLYCPLTEYGICLFTVDNSDQTSESNSRLVQ